MPLNELKRTIDPAVDEKLFKTYNQFNNLIQCLQNHDLPEEINIEINKAVDLINKSNLFGLDLAKQIKVNQNAIINKVVKQLKLVPKNYYRMFWSSLGITAIGLPIGVGLSTYLKNIAYIALGLPIGLGLGHFIGQSLDKKAQQEGRQLDFDMK